MTGTTPEAGAGDGTVSWRALWRETAATLATEAGLVLDRDTARAEARWLCQEASGCGSHEWHDTLDRPATVRAVARLDDMVARRRTGEPLAYVLGSWSFRTVELMVDHRVLIPRPETELVVEVALERLRRRPKPYLVADLGTGSGAIALAMTAELPITGVEVWATDRSPDALDVARANLAGLGRRAANVRVVEGSWWEALPEGLRGRLHVVVSNPPYVAAGDEVDDGVRRWEPAGALDGGTDGLDAVRVLVGGAGEWLVPGGWLVVEIGAGQGAAAAALAGSAGLVEVEVRPDLAGRDRVLVARRPA